MVKLSNKYEDEVVCISVNTDSQSDPLFSKSLEFLKEQESHLKNVVLMEDEGTWTEHFGIAAWPGLFVYGKDGKRSEPLYDYADLRKELEKHLQE